ncbi:tyrosine-type recombinase/integrase [Luteimonas sp. R10]|uniref:tyrosine-type recombinase/integrase n=1 Tax=Luteimonas sp. R10 TaxID=3108176 RepID=UPI00308736FC|nr:site-specific integrase [Luteimonas sp. R10]
MNQLRAAGNGPATINRKLSVVSVVPNKAADLDRTYRPPRIPRQSGERKREFVLTEEEFDELLEAVRARDDRKEGVKGGHPVKRDASEYADLCAVLYETGLRPAEALKLPWTNIRLERREIVVRHAPHRGLRNKTNKSRTVPMTDRAYEVLLARWGKIKGGPFHNLNHRRLNEHWAAAREALGVDDKDCVPYATRHSLATRLIEETGDLHQAKEWLGHSTITLTSDTYGHVSKKYLTKGADALNSRRQQVTENPQNRDRFESVTDMSPAAIPQISNKIN